MPYGSNYEYDSTKPSVTGRNSYPGGGKNYNLLSPYGTPSHTKLLYSRSGTNRNSTVGSQCSKPPGTFALVPVSVPKGPRLSYKVYSKRLKKFVWAREPITVYRLKRISSKSRPAKGLDLLPNALNFQARRISYYGGNGGGSGTWTGVYQPDPEYQRHYSGDLWASFLPLGSDTALAPNAQAYTSGSISDRFTSAVSSVEKEARSRFYEATKGQKINIGQALAERAQTASLIKDIAVRVFKAYSALRKGNLASAASTIFPTSSKKLANDWLILQYGINPLISDIKGAANLLASPVDFQFDVKKGKRLQLERVLIDQAGSTTGNPPHQTKVWSEGFVEVTYKARFRVTSAGMRHLNQVGLTNLPALGWELLPYSFVIDWLLPIGDYLNSQDAFDNLELVYCTKTVFVKEYITFERVLGGNNAGYVYPTQTYGFINERISCVRSLETVVPPLEFPSFKDPVSAGHIANAIALLRQLKK